MESCIRAIGTSNPSNRVSQLEILRFMKEAYGLNEKQATRLESIYEHSAISYRHSVLDDFGKDRASRTFFSKSRDMEPFPGTAERMRVYEREASKLGALAVNNCFKKHPEIDRSQITHLITVSCTGMHAPGLDIELVEKLGLHTDVERICINFMGCYGAFNALRTANYICTAQKDAWVLVVGVELCTLHFQKKSTLDNWLANALFADGAAAVLLHAGNGKQEEFPSLRLKKFHTEILSGTKDEMAWHIGNFGFEMKLSAKVPGNILSSAGKVTEKLLSKAGIRADEIHKYAIHPGGRTILEACEKVLGIKKEMNRYSYEVLRDYGNMSSVTVLFVLEKLMSELNETDSGKKVLSMAFGPGLTVESMILEVN